MADAPEKKKPSLKERLAAAFDAAKKTGKAVYDDAAKTGKETLDTLGVLVNENTPEGEKPKDLTIQERVGIATDHLGKTEWLKVVKDTAQDLTKKDELKRLAGTVIALPGGLAVYGAYRVAKHRKEKLEEDAAKTKKKQSPKPPKAA